MTKIPLKKKLNTPVQWQVWFAYVPFDGSKFGKMRPVLVTEVNGHFCNILEISSAQQSHIADVSIIDPNVAGLSLKSIVQVRKSSTISKESLRKYLGTLSRDDRENVKNSIVRWKTDNSKITNGYEMYKIQKIFRTSNPLK